MQLDSTSAGGDQAKAKGFDIGKQARGSSAEEVMIKKNCGVMTRAVAQIHFHVNMQDTLAIARANSIL